MFGRDDNNQDEQNQSMQGQAPAVMPDPIDNSTNSEPTPVENNSPSGPPVPLSAPADDHQDAGSDSDLMSSAPSDDLVSIKQEALQHLTPLVGHLDQTPEEKFRTLMMMIQATDDHTKLKEAFESAKQITDDKTRAQALLDVINEINYFTQNANQ